MSTNSSYDVGAAASKGPNLTYEVPTTVAKTIDRSIVLLQGETIIQTNCDYTLLNDAIKGAQLLNNHNNLLTVENKALIERNVTNATELLKAFNTLLKANALSQKNINAFIGFEQIADKIAQDIIGKMADQAQT